MSTTNSVEETKTECQVAVESVVPREEVDVATTSDRMVGQVKWFNNKAGFGFITLNDGEKAGTDIFAHYSTINVADSQYRYLIQGEYVEFDLSVSTNGTHEFQASKISGIKGGKLMCETRQVNRYVRRETFMEPHSVQGQSNERRSYPTSGRERDREVYERRPPVHDTRERGERTPRVSSRGTRESGRDSGRDSTRESTRVSEKVAVDKDGFQKVGKKRTV